MGAIGMHVMKSDALKLGRMRAACGHGCAHSRRARIIEQARIRWNHLIRGKFLAIDASVHRAIPVQARNALAGFERQKRLKRDRAAGPLPAVLQSMNG